MTLDELRNSAEFYARIDQLPFLVKVMLEFDQASGHLTTTYVVDRGLSESSDDCDVDDCELIEAEVMAAFPDVRTAETIYVDGVRNADSEIEVSVYLR